MRFGAVPYEASHHPLRARVHERARVGNAPEHSGSRRGIEGRIHLGALLARQRRGLRLVGADRSSLLHAPGDPELVLAGASQQAESIRAARHARDLARRRLPDREERVPALRAEVEAHELASAAGRVGRDQDPRAVVLEREGSRPLQRPRLQVQGPHDHGRLAVRVELDGQDPIRAALADIDAVGRQRIDDDAPGSGETGEQRPESRRRVAVIEVQECRAGGQDGHLRPEARDAAHGARHAVRGDELGGRARGELHPLDAPVAGQVRGHERRLLAALEAQRARVARARNDDGLRVGQDASARELELPQAPGAARPIEDQGRQSLAQRQGGHGAVERVRLPGRRDGRGDRGGPQELERPALESIGQDPGLAGGELGQPHRVLVDRRHSTAREARVGGEDVVGQALEGIGQERVERGVIRGRQRRERFLLAAPLEDHLDPIPFFIDDPERDRESAPLVGVRDQRPRVEEHDRRLVVVDVERRFGRDRLSRGELVPLLVQVDGREAHLHVVLAAPEIPHHVPEEDQRGALLRGRARALAGEGELGRLRAGGEPGRTGQGPGSLGEERAVDVDLDAHVHEVRRAVGHREAHVRGPDDLDRRREDPLDRRWIVPQPEPVRVRAGHDLP